jgi:endonuclease YncB( thermonuclease family)
LIAGGVNLEPHGRDRYDRLLAVVSDREGHDLARVMIREGHARPYDGRGRRLGWCEPN